jgi:hypothetical protein
MQRTHVLVGSGTVAAVFAAGAILTYTLAGTESTTGLDDHTTVTVDGHRALDGDIVAGRTQSRYSPLPWVGTEVKDVRCPALKAVAGTSVTCTAKKGDGGRIEIPVRVVKADESSVTWKFER